MVEYWMDTLDNLKAALFSNHYPRARKAAAQLAAFNTPEAVAILREALHSPHRRVRQSAMQGAAICKDVGCIPQLIHILIHDDYFLRRAASKALGAIGEPAIKDLLDVIENENVSRYTFRYAIDALRIAKSYAALERLIKFMQANLHTRPEFAVHAAIALGDIGHADAVPALVATLDYFDPRSQQSVI